MRGVVQGVGFRPFVHRAAAARGLSGWVRNDADGVAIEAEGPVTDLEAFVAQLRGAAPSPARVDGVTVREGLPPRPGDRGFRIAGSAAAGPLATTVGPDTAPCDDCLGELLDPGDRRWRHAFIGCAACGPRYTITLRLPYDRATTSMAGFTPCADCAAEYRAPQDRRFHAEANACPRCGPQLAWHGADGQRVDGVDPLAAALDAISAGRTVAVKGVGGYHLVCDARQGGAVAALRRRKSREAKPFAVMVAGVASLAGLAECSPAQAGVLAGPERPIVLLRKAPGADEQLPGVAPGLARLGVMLPPSPLHLLLFHEAAGRPAGTGWLERAQPLVLLATSANPRGEPLVVDDEQALTSLAGIADGWLVHDRAIVRRCDDSVVSVPALPDDGSAAGRRLPALRFVRRARGHAPQPIRLTGGGPPVLALGGAWRTTACALRDDLAVLSPHVGDLDSAAACRALDEAVEPLLALLQPAPAAIAHDLHPDFHGARLARQLADGSGALCLAVQHHHAHVAAVLAEHGVEGPVLGLALDGMGLGVDGAAWGGELLELRGAGFTRLGHLRTLRLPGGDRAAREPWRVAVGALVQAGRDDLARARFGDEPALDGVLQLLQRPALAPPTSSLGRWFDAASAVLGVERRNGHEAQAAMRLEGLAEGHGEVDPEPDGVQWTSAGGPDLGPLLVALAGEPCAARGAARFHATLAWALAEWAARAAAARSLDTVACAGGCLLNGVLVAALARRLRACGLRVLLAGAVPPNDGALALGQAWVARRALLAGGGLGDSAAGQGAAWGGTPAGPT